MVGQQDPTGAFMDLFGDEGANSFSPPGADETVAFIQLLEFIQDPEFDLVVFDTAPTGHTLKLLQLPELTQNWLFRLIKMRQRIGGLMSGFKSLLGGSELDEQDAFERLEELRDQVEIARKHLMNNEETQFVAVTIPTIMAIWETERLIRALFEVAFPIKQIYINMLQPENADCKFCRNRHSEQKNILEKIIDLYDEFDLKEIPAFEYEIRGVDRLRELGILLYGNLP